LQADWSKATVEDTALNRLAVRENWPAANGEAILETLTSAVSTIQRPWQAVRLAQLLLFIDRPNERV